MNIPQFVKPNKMNVEIERVITQLSNTDPKDENYAVIAANLVTLYDAKAKNAKAFKVNPDVLVAAGANIVGILLVLNYEKLGIITSKAMNLLVKNKI